MRFAPRDDGLLEDVGDEHGDLAVVGDGEHVEVDAGHAGRRLGLDDLLHGL